MAKRMPKRATITKRSDSAEVLRRALARQTKPQLVDLVLELASSNHAIFRQLSARFDVATTAEELLAATHVAISDATDFDEREIGHNFQYDHEAYDQVKRNLSRLVAMGELPRVMELALDLMKQGSYQVEMSDEGLMAYDIEDCLSAVLKALQKCDLPADQVLAWCTSMLERDRVKFIAIDALKALRKSFQKM